MKNFAIEVLLVEPGERPRKELIYNSLDDFKILPADKIKKYRKQFWKIEKFTNKKISDAYRDIWFRRADEIFA